MINYVSIAKLTALDLSAEASGRSTLQPCSRPVHPIFQTSPASKLLNPLSSAVANTSIYPVRASLPIRCEAGHERARWCRIRAGMGRR